MFEESVVFLDVETTGAYPARDRITEIGLVELDHGRPIGEWSTLVNPETHIPGAIQALTGITDAMVEDAPVFADIAPALHERLAGKLLVAHNARFDYGFLRHEFRRAGLRYASRVLCTVKLSRKLHPGHARHNLDSLIARHGIACEARHRALGDARALWLLADRWQQDDGGPAVAAAAAELLAVPALPPGMADGTLDDVPEAAGVYIFHGADGAVLYVGRSANLRSCVTSYFTGGRRRAVHLEIAQRAARVDWIETAGDLSAQIEEARLVRELAPVFNRRSRRAGASEAGPWPFRGRIAVRERGAQALIVLDRWCYLGTARSEVELYEICDCARPDFDPETGRMLARFLAQPRRAYEIIELTGNGGLTTGDSRLIMSPITRGSPL